MAEYGVYPDLTKVNGEKGNGNGIAYRLAVINSRLERLSSNQQQYTSSSKKESRRHSNLAPTNGILSSVSIATTTAGGVVSVIGVGIIGGGGLRGVGPLFGIGTLHLDKKVVSRLNTYENLVTLCNSRLSFLEKMISKAMPDEEISDQEFELIMDEFDKYEAERVGLLELKRKKNTELAKEQKTMAEAMVVWPEVQASELWENSLPLS